MRYFSLSVAVISLVWLGATLPSIAFGQSAPVAALTLSASKSEVGLGKTTRLDWFGTGVERCVASGDWSGVYEGRLASKGRFTTPALTSRENVFVLTCTGQGGTARASVTVFAIPKPTVTLTASPESLIPGQSLQLRWTSVDASTCRGSGSGFSGEKLLSGQETLSDLTKGRKKFSLSCKGVGGSTKTTAEVQVVPVPTLTFSARKVEIAEGQSAQLKWRAKDATRCVASGDWSGEQSLAGSFKSDPLTETQSYTLRCEGANGSVSETVSVSVIPAPTVSLASDKLSVPEGESFLITWTSTDAVSCKASGAWKGDKALAGSELVDGLRAGTKKFTLQCQGAGGKASFTQVVTILKAPTLRFRATKTEIARGASAKLSWSAKNVELCEANGAWSGPQALVGSYTTPSLNQNGQYRYALTCRGPGGQITESVLIRVGTEFPELFFEANPATLKPGNFVNLRWESSQATQCLASGSWQGAKATRGSEDIFLSNLGQYAFTLSCDNSIGTSEETLFVTVDNPEYSVSVSEVNFDSIFTGTRSDAFEIILRNSSRLSIDIRNIEVIGADSSEFITETECGSVLAAETFCRSFVRFVPRSSGVKNAILRFSTDGDPAVTDVRLSGQSLSSSVSFSLEIPSFIQTDSDVNDPLASYVMNDSAASAQFVTWPFAIGGFVARAGASIPGAELTRADSEDYFRVRLTENQSVVLEIAAETGLEDLDVFLYTTDGVLVDSSIAPAGVSREIVSATEENEYIILVHAFAGGAKYLLVSDSSITTANFGRSVLSMDFLPGRALSSLTSNAKIRLGREITRSQSYLTLSAATPESTVGLNVISGDLGSVFAAALPAQSVSLPYGRFRDSDQQKKFETLWGIKRLSGNPELSFVEPDFIVSIAAEPNDPEYARQKWHYDVIQAPAAWDMFQGSDDVVVAVIDSGVSRHPDLVENLLGGYDFVSSDPDGDGDGRDNDPSDPGIIRTGSSIRDSHGTHVAGTIAARGNNALGVTGVAWRTKILPIRALDATGRGSISDIVAAMRYAADLGSIRPPRKADIINLSLGSDSSTCSGAYQQAVDEVRAAGLIVVAAAGNSGFPFVGSPANCRGVVAVSALGPQKQLSVYSNYGSALDIAAPGGDGPSSVFSTEIRRENNGPVTFTYSGNRGTSMATPHVAGVIALMKGVRPELDPGTLDAILVNGGMSDDIGATGKDLLYGHGAINAVRALNSSQEPLPTTAPFEAFFSPGRLDFGDTVSQIALTVTLTGDTSVFERFDVRGPTSFLDLSSVVPVDANTAAAVFSVRRDALPIGSTTASLIFDAVLSTGIRRYSLPVTVTRNPTSYVGDGGAMYAVLFDPVRRETVGAASVDAVGPRASGQIEVETTGDYWLVVGSDTDNDFFICGLGEACAAYPISSGLWQTIPVVGEVSGIDIEATYLNRLTVEGAQTSAIAGLGQAYGKGISRRQGEKESWAKASDDLKVVDRENSLPVIEYRYIDINEKDDFPEVENEISRDQTLSFPSEDPGNSPDQVETSDEPLSIVYGQGSSQVIAQSAVPLKNHLVSYRLIDSMTEWGIQSWVLESINQAKNVESRVVLPDTAPVIWRLGDTGGVALPSIGLTQQCGEAVYSLIDGYGLTVSRHDLGLVRGEHRTISIRSSTEAVLVLGMDCDEGRLQVSGVSLPVSAEMPSGVNQNSVHFSFSLNPHSEHVLDPDKMIRLNDEVFDVSSLCGQPSEARLKFCRDLRSAKSDHARF